MTDGGSDERLQRAPYVRIYEQSDALTVLGDDGIRRFTGDSAALARAVLDQLREPRTRTELLARIAELANEPEPARLGVVDEVLTILQTSGVIVKASVAPTPATPATLSRVVLALSGGIAAAHAPLVTELLIARGLEVRIAATPSALRFVKRTPLEALTQHPVVSRPWSRDPREPVPHLALSSWADVVVVHPATATTLGRIACGDCSTVVSAVAISARRPVIVVPAMNSSMFDAPSIQRNLALLRDDGFIIMHPSFGYEVAEAPSQRRPAFGAAPVVQAVVDVTLAVLRERE